MGATEAPELSSGRLLPVPPPASLRGRRRARSSAAPPAPFPGPATLAQPALTRPSPAVSPRLGAASGRRLRRAPPVPVGSAGTAAAGNSGRGVTGAEAAAAGASDRRRAHPAPPVPRGSGGTTGSEASRETDPPQGTERRPGVRKGFVC